MAHALALESQLIALELHRILRSIDPARWRDEAEVTARRRLEDLRDRLARLLDGTDPGRSDPALASLRERLTEVALRLEYQLPARSLPDPRAAWNAFRLEVLPSYEQLAAGLHRFDIHVPSLRPTNYARNVYHLGSGLFTLLLVEWLLDLNTMLVVGGAFAATAWTMEISRRYSPRINRLLLWMFSPFAHPHEAWRVNSATWYTTALFGLALLQDKALACVAITVLAVADPFAAVIGRRFGRRTIINGRTVEGTSAFILAGTLSAAAALMVFHPTIPSLLLCAFAAGLFGGIAELLSRRVDDNLSIPLAAAVGMWVVQTVF